MKFGISVLHAVNIYTSPQYTLLKLLLDCMVLLSFGGQIGKAEAAESCMEMIASCRGRNIATTALWCFPISMLFLATPHHFKGRRPAMVRWQVMCCSYNHLSLRDIHFVSWVCTTANARSAKVHHEVLAPNIRTAQQRLHEPVMEHCARVHVSRFHADKG